jgi:hypothetical protein
VNLGWRSPIRMCMSVVCDKVLFIFIYFLYLQKEDRFLTARAFDVWRENRSFNLLWGLSLI